MLTLPWDNPVLAGFYVFEGIDGAGTTTQAKRLTAHLSQTVSASFTFEPTDRPIGRVIREYLTGEEGAEARTLSLLFAADRKEHLDHPIDGIRARIARDERVICDRYLFSSLAYQGSADDFAFVELLNGDFPLPEHLFFIDTPVDEADRRLSTRTSRDRLETRSIQEKVHDAYRAIIKDFQRSAVQVHHIDGNDDPDSIFTKILTALADP